jgi:AcrR family transcriptional regulator
MEISDPPDTKSRILIAAESLFAKHGYAGVTLRQITAQAGVNLAAVNYHYYDKESLYREILTARLRIINRRRLDLLTAAGVRAGDDPIPLPEVIEALARPLFLPDPTPGTVGCRLLGRLLAERPGFTDELIRTEFQPVMTRFGQAIRRHMPALPPADFVWRFSFVIGAMHHALVTLPDMALLTDGLCRVEDTEAAFANFRTFAVNALSI